jgi:hypothetical protein
VLRESRGTKGMFAPSPSLRVFAEQNYKASFYSVAAEERVRRLDIAVGLLGLQ